MSEEKRKPTKIEIQKMKNMYLKGVKPREIVKKFPELDINAVQLSKNFSKEKLSDKKKIVQKKAEEKLLDSLAEQQAEANKKLVEVSTKVVDIIQNYLETGQYNDFTIFRYGSLLKKNGNTINALAFSQIIKALADAQKIQRTALGMDKELAEKLPQPIINIDFGEDDKQ